MDKEKGDWEKVKERSRMELEGEVSSSTTTADEGVNRETPSTTSESTPEKVKARAATVAEGSDEDAVLVEKAANTVPSLNGAAGGKSKKKKGKK